MLRPNAFDPSVVVDNTKGCLNVLVHAHRIVKATNSSIRKIQT